MLQIDLDGGSNEDPVGAYRIDHWETSALARAGRAFKRQCRWDFSADETGVARLRSTVRSHRRRPSDDLAWTGTLTGFVILHDRDEDGNYESLAISPPSTPRALTPATSPIAAHSDSCCPTFSPTIRTARSRNSSGTSSMYFLT